MSMTRLSAGERELLRRMETEYPEELLTRAIPGGWWFDLDQVHARIPWSLIRKGLIKSSYGNIASEYSTWMINEEGSKALADPAYVPLIVRHLLGERIT